MAQRKDVRLEPSVPRREVVLDDDRLAFAERLLLSTRERSVLGIRDHVPRDSPDDLLALHSDELQRGVVHEDDAHLVVEHRERVGHALEDFDDLQRGRGDRARRALRAGAFLERHGPMLVGEGSILRNAIAGRTRIGQPPPSAAAGR